MLSTGVFDQGRHKSTEFHSELETTTSATGSTSIGPAKRADKIYVGVNVYHYNRQARYESSVDHERNANQRESADLFVEIGKWREKTAILSQFLFSARAK